MNRTYAMFGRLAPLVIVVIGLSGCSGGTPSVDVTIVPHRDGSFERKLLLPDPYEDVSGSAGGWIDPEARAHYQSEVRLPKGGVELHGVMRDVPPDVVWRDWHNDGGYEVLDSHAGWVGWYHERQPGPRHPHAQLMEALETIDLFTELLATAARRELAAEPGSLRLAEYLEGPFRTDLKDITVTFLSSNDGLTSGDPDDDLGRTELRSQVLLHLLEEQGHLRLSNILAPGATDPMDWMIGWVADKMGRPDDEALKQRIAERLDGEFGESIFRALEERSMGRGEEEIAREWFRIVELVFAMDVLDEWLETDYQLELPAGAVVIETNGTLDEEGRGILWESKVDVLPTQRFCLAIWSVPDTVWQTEHLGDVFLTGVELRHYAEWVAELPEHEATAWRSAVDRVRPGPSLQGDLEAIRVTAESRERDDVEYGARLLVNALRGEDDPEQPLIW